MRFSGKNSAIAKDGLGKRLRVDYEGLRETRRLSLMSAKEIRDLALAGIDIQLHTHRHQLPGG